MLPDPVVRMTQFYRAKEDGTQFHGSCGQTALAVCIGAARGEPHDFEGTGELMIALTHDMIARGIAAPNGAATLAAYAQQARDAGCIVAVERRYREPLDGWRDLLLANAGLRPILLQVAHGEHLTDAETGARDEEGLRYHAIAVVGVQDDVFLAVDGDNPQATRRFQLYTQTTLEAARPCGLLILEMQRGRNTEDTGGSRKNTEIV